MQTPETVCVLDRAETNDFQPKGSALAEGKGRSQAREGMRVRGQKEPEKRLQDNRARNGCTRGIPMG